MSFYLAIDTSNYTTSVAIAEDDKIIENRKMLLPVKEGERGLRQSDAVFAHIKNLPEIFDGMKKREYTAIGYSATPRDVEGSYMPCFECGKAVAKALSESMSIPLYHFSHQRGHIRAAAYSAGYNNILDEEALAFHVSGGTTELLHIKNGEINLVGGTLDLNAGQCVDRVGVLLGLSFPCGKELEALAGECEKQKVKTCVNGLECNLSGVENQVMAMINKGVEKDVIASYVLDFIGETLAKITKNARAEFGPLPVLYAGGVMSNKRIRKTLSSMFDNTYFASPEFSCDNAAGCALLTREKHLKTNI